jgi:hypothetical protein
MISQKTPFPELGLAGLCQASDFVAVFKMISYFFSLPRKIHIFEQNYQGQYF